MPFNLGKPDGFGGAGAVNPLAPKGKGYPSWYVWEHSWPKDVWLEIFGNFLHLEVKRVEAEGIGCLLDNLFFALLFRAFSSASALQHQFHSGAKIAPTGVPPGRRQLAKYFQKVSVFLNLVATQTETSKSGRSTSHFIGQLMPHIRAKLLLEMNKTERLKTRDEAASDARAAAPELYPTLFDAECEAERAYKAVNEKHRTVIQLYDKARGLTKGLKGDELEADVSAASAAAAPHLATLVSAIEKNLNRLGLAGSIGYMAYLAAKNEFDRSFSLGYGDMP